MTEAVTGNPPQRPIQAPILRLPLEVRLRIYHFLHTEPKISIYEGYHPRRAEEVVEAGASIRRLAIPSTNASGQREFELVCEDYDWRYLLTCRTINSEAQFFLPQALHLLVRSKHYSVELIPLDVRRRYLPHVQTLSIVGSYPQYYTPFDGGQLPSLKTVHLLDEEVKSRIFQRHHLVSSDGGPSLEEEVALVLGAQDQQFIALSKHKMSLSKTTWWHRWWLHDLLCREEPTSQIQVLVQQHVLINFAREPHPGGPNPLYKAVVMVCFHC